MQITKIEVTGFKSLQNFWMDLSQFSCLIGLNGSGKSTVLQAIDFLSQLVKGKMDEWFELRGWEASDIKCALSNRKIILFSVELSDEELGDFTWNGAYNIREKQCTDELIKWKAPGTLLFVPLLRRRRKQFKFRNSLESDASFDKKKFTEIDFVYQGSILSQLKEGRLLIPLVAFHRFFCSTQSFDMLSPQSLRKKNRQSKGTIGLGGEQLSAFLYELGNGKKEALTEQLQKVYPSLSELVTSSLRSGWKNLSIKENYAGHSIRTEAKHVNDGMLRLIAILAELASEHGFLLFDEIENGINAELVEFLIDILTNANQQIMVTTHSPMILNYLDDERAIESVVYLYKGKDGSTRARRFFDIPSIRTKLEVMGPGEAFVDTDLVTLADEISTLTEAG